MKPQQTLLYGLILASIAAPLAQAADDQLSEFQRFRSYPFLDKGYKEAKKNNWAEVERLMRHLLDRVPSNTEARALLIQSLAKQQRYADAEREAQALAGTDAGAQALTELRLDLIENGPPPEAQVNQWLAHTSNANERVRLWQAYSLKLGQTKGAAKALDWLGTLPPGNDGRVLREARANWAEQLRDWDTTIAQLAPLAAAHQLSADDWRRLANAYAQRLEEKPLEQLIQQAPDADSARRARLAIIDRAIAVEQTEVAKRWLLTLPEQDRRDPTRQAQLLEVARDSSDAALVTQLSDAQNRPCLETTEWLSRHDQAAALAKLQQCKPTDDPKTWLVLAQRLEATDLLENTRLPEPWDTARRDQLVDSWRRQGRTDLALAWLSRQPQTPDTVRQRAELLQARGRTGEAAALWEQRYRQTGDLKALDQASYLALNAGRTERAKQLLESAYDRRGGNLPPTLLQRLAGIHARSDTPLDVARIEALLPKADPVSRGYLLGRLAEAGRCDALQRYLSPDSNTPGDLRALGRCAMPARPGEAVVYYQAAIAHGDKDSQLPLAYALEAAGDPVGALRIFNALPASELNDNARLTASRAALLTNDNAGAERYWQQAKKGSADDWALGANIADARGDYPLALTRHREALQHEPNGQHYYNAAGSAQKAGDKQQSKLWLAEAVRREPNNPRFRADYGMRLAGTETPEERRTAIPYLERATRDYPEDFRLGETLAWRYDEAEDSFAARRELRRVIDLEQDPVAADDEYGSLEARRFRQRRAHQTLSQRDNLTIASTWSPAGVTTVPILNGDTQTGDRRRAQSQNLQTFIWDHALGEEPTRNGSTLSVYGRAIAGNEGRKNYTQTLAAGFGLRYKPFGDYNLNLYGELYKQNTVNDDVDPEDAFDGLRWHEIGTPEKFERYIRKRDKYGQTSTDFLLRATASFLDQGEYRNDWRVDESDWDERFLYTDFAWWTHAGDHQWVSRYQQGHTWKLPVDSPQTIMPYGFAEFSAQDPSNDWRQDLRSGVGLRWQYWYGEDRYNAYRAHVTVRTEYQLGMAGNLYEKANGWLVGLEVNF